MTKRNLLLISGVAVGLLIVWLLVNQHDKDPNGPQPVQAGATEQNTASAKTAMPVKVENNVTEIDNTKAFHLAIAQMVKQRFGERLDSPYWRMKLINDLMILFKEHYPNHWRSELEDFFRNAFPEIAEDLLRKLAALLEYNDWLDSLKATMKFASLKERQAALWEKRLALFGEEAYDIWEAALKTEQLQEKIAEVDEYAGNFAEKADLYRDSLQEIFGEDVLAEDAPHKTQKMTKFLELDSVQEELRRLPVAQRYQELRDFRESFGMDDAALERWDALDQERIEMWSKAEIYMAEREKLSQQYQGDQFTQKLTELQNQLFGETEAKYIRNEERSGYYRFDKPQKVGLN